MPNSPQPHHPRLGRSAPRRWSWARRRSYPAESGVFAMKNGEFLGFPWDFPKKIMVSWDLTGTSTGFSPIKNGDLTW